MEVRKTSGVGPNSCTSKSAYVDTDEWLLILESNRIMTQIL